MFSLCWSHGTTGRSSILATKGAAETAFSHIDVSLQIVPRGLRLMLLM